MIYLEINDEFEILNHTFEMIDTYNTITQTLNPEIFTNWDFNSNKLQMIKIDEDQVSWKKHIDSEKHGEILFFGS